MPSKYPTNIPEDLLKEAATESPPKQSKPPDKPSGSSPQGSKQRRLFKRKRAGVVLTREQVKEIKAGRKKLKSEMKANGAYSKREFEAVASSLGLYFDKRNKGFIGWLFTHWLGALIASLIVLLLVILIFAAMTRLRGFYTVNLSERMFRNGFELCETKDFLNPVSELFAQPAENVPCISIKSIPENVDEIDGLHNEDYFAYTYYIANRGAEKVDFTWELLMNSETKSLSSAAWIALYVDGKLSIYAAKSADEGSEALPPFGVTDKGYRNLAIVSTAPESEQFEVIKRSGALTYYRVIPYRFESDKIIASGKMVEVEPGDIHKYTVVMWLEGDDPDADNSKIGGHIGVQMNFRLAGEDSTENRSFSAWWESVFG